MIAEGALIGSRYRLDQPIGHGQAGIVWLAFDTRLHRTVTAKRMYIPPGLQPALAEDARAVALREGRAACQIVHSCVVRTHDAFAEAEDVWLIMEYVPSRSMDEFLAEHGRLTVEQTATLGVQLGSALAAAHALDITHGSLEPANVLLADDGGVKITDVGVSGPGPSPAYRAPELAASSPASPASDAFSLGASLYAAIEGTAPFGPDGRAEQAPPHHSGVLTGALLKLLRTDPSMRPTVQDTVTALRAAGTDNEGAAIPPTAPPGTHTQQAQGVSTVPASVQQQRPHAPTVPHEQAPPAPSHVPAGNGTAAPQPGNEAPPRAGRSATRNWIVTVVAVLVAVAAGILFTEFVIL